MKSYQEEVIPVQQRFKVEKERIEDSFEPDKDLSQVSPITHGIKAEKHTDVYKMHRYFARRPHNVFNYLIDHYSNKGSLILDPFCGGGVTIIEGLRLKRKVLGVDFNPLATFVTRTEAMDFDIVNFEKYFEKIKNSVEKQINELYEVKCPGCGKVLIAGWFGWDVVLHCKECKNDVVIRDAKKILNKAGRGTGKFECPYCKNVLVAHTDKINEIPTVISVRCSCGYEGGKKPDENDLKNLAGIDRKLKEYEQKGYWYPKDEIPKGDKTKEALNKGYTYFYELFTNRNLLALSILLKEIEEITDENCKLLFKLAFSQTLAGATKLCNDPISGWQAHAYWIPNQMFEMNVWGYFKRNVKAVLDGKTDSKNTIGDYFKEGKSFQDLLGDNKTCLILTKSSTDLKRIIPDESVDVVITDPPYGGNVNYSELSNFWAVWLKEEFGLEKENLIDNTEEAIENRTQNKGPNEYQDLLFGVLKEVHRVLKKDSWLVMTFHNRKFAVWKALHLAAYDAGFMLPERHGIIYQSPIAAYTYTFHQRAGGAMLGDFIVSFRRLDNPPKRDFETTLSRGEYDKLMAEIRKVIEFHGGATDNMIFMQLMPFLMNSGLLHKVGVEKLDRLLDKSLFVKIKDKWHLKENIDEKTGKVNPIQFIPAEQRIEELIRSLLLEKVSATMDEILVAVFTNLINGDTPTNEEITHVLDRICSRNDKTAKRTVFRLKKQIDLDGEIKRLKGKKADAVKRKAKVKQKLLSGEVVEMGDEEGGIHSTMIHNLYKLGKEKGYEVHIGHTEQRKSKMFNEISYPMASNVQFGVSNEVFSVIREIDVLWITKGNTITHAFEIEATTNIITGISRFRELFISAPNITINTFIAVPEKRRVLAINKINSPANRKEGISERIKCITFEDIFGKQLDF